MLPRVQSSFSSYLGALFRTGTDTPIPRRFPACSLLQYRKNQSLVYSNYSYHQSPYPQSLVISHKLRISLTTRPTLISTHFPIKASYDSYHLNHIHPKLTITLPPPSNKAHGVLAHHPLLSHSNPSDWPTSTAVIKMALPAEAIPTYPILL